MNDNTSHDWRRTFAALAYDPDRDPKRILDQADYVVETASLEPITDDLIDRVIRDAAGDPREAVRQLLAGQVIMLQRQAAGPGEAGPAVFTTATRAEAATWMMPAVVYFDDDYDGPQDE